MSNLDWLDYILETEDDEACMPQEGCSELEEHSPSYFDLFGRE